MGRFTDLFQENNQPEEVFAPSPVVESAEISAPGPSAPEAVAEEKEVFNPNARDGDGDGLLQEGTPYERPVSERKVRKRI
jgi:hypothetical protein